MVDMQNDFVHDDGVFVKQWQKTNRWAKEIIPPCQNLLTAAREADVTPIHLRIINDLLRNPVVWFRGRTARNERPELDRMFRIRLSIRG